MTVFTPLIGRFGNQLFQYAHARKFCELNGHTLATPPWVGEKIFDIPEAVRSVEEGDRDVIFLGEYRQAQKDLIYSRKWCLDTLKLKPVIEAVLRSFVPIGGVVAHRRVGDYATLSGYPVVSQLSYLAACSEFGIEPTEIEWITEENPSKHPAFTGDLAFLPDFYRMMKAKVLFRGNSSFSYWASVLGEARTFSPCIKGKPGGVESDCEFIEGNHERFCELEFVQDLRLFSDEDRYNYPLNKDSLVFDVGGYEGDFAAVIQKRHGCAVEIFEPCFEFSQKLRKRFQANAKIKVWHLALGARNETRPIYWKGNMTGEFSDGVAESATFIDIASVMDGRNVDLIKINAEGAEFEILERILECEIAKRFTNIQTQFHGVVPDCQRRYAAIREGLLKTHRLTYDEPWVWQNFALRA